MIPAPLRLPASPLGRAALGLAALVAAVALSLSPGGLAPVAARAALAAGAILALWVLARRRGTAALAPEVAVVDRARLAPGAGIALVEAGGRRLLVGFGREGARLVADLGPARPSTGREDAP